MLTFLDVLIGISLLVVLATLGMGLISMHRGGEYAAANSNKFMRWRVMAQGVAIVLLIIGFVVKATGGAH
jgi:hypothetical protein